MTSYSILSRKKIRLRLLATTLVVQALYWLWAIADGMYSSRNFQFSKFSWVVNDQVWIAKESFYSNVPLWGAHRFSDLTIFWSYVADPLPYAHGGRFVPTIAPIGLSFYAFLSSFGFQAGLCIFLIFSFVSPALLIRTFLKEHSFSDHVVAYCGLVFLNMSVLVAIDRGNLLPIIVPVLGYLIYKLMISSPLGMAEVLVFAAVISIKPYLLMVLILFIGERKYRFTIYVLLTTAISNIVASLAFGMSPLKIFSSILGAQSGYVNEVSLQNSINISAAAFKAVYVLIRFIDGESAAASYFQTHPQMIAVPGLIYLLAVVLICVQSRIPLWVRVVAAVSTIQMVVSASPRYDLSFSLLVGLVILQNFDGSSESDSLRHKPKEILVAIFCWLAFLLSVLPIVASIYLAPLAWCFVVILVLCLYGVRIPSRRLS
jgi:hypothetical protein